MNKICISTVTGSFMCKIGTAFSFGIVTLALISFSIALKAQSRPQASKPQTAVSQSSASKHSIFKKSKPHTPVAPIQEEQSQPSEQAQTRAWLQDAASRVQVPDAATLREEIRQSERLRQQSRDRVTPQSQQVPRRDVPVAALFQSGQI